MSNGYIAQLFTDGGSKCDELTQGKEEPSLDVNIELGVSEGRFLQQSQISIIWEIAFSTGDIAGQFLCLLQQRGPIGQLMEIQQFLDWGILRLEAC